MPLAYFRKAAKSVTTKRNFGSIFVGGVNPRRHRSHDEDFTGTPRNLHDPVYEGSYSEIAVRGAFVVQLRTVGSGRTGNLDGSVEEVDSGKELRFHSADELLVFLRECFARSCQRASLNEGTK